MSANGCTACPRECGKSRVGEELGFCQAPNEFVIARIARHAWEEPCISGKDGSGTVFFSGCNLRCVYCQNRVISHTAKGEILTPDELEAQMLRLQEEGAHNINLVTPSHYALQLRPLLAHIKPRLHIPIVYNCGGYEKTETLRTLDGLVDVYLPDIKYFDGHRAQLYSAAPGYFPTAVAALREMLRQVGRCEYDTDGMMTRGVIVRHLVLPGGRQDSITAKGEILTPDELEAQMLRLQEEGAHNINLVTPSHYALQLRPLLAHIKPRLHIPIVYNCGGYEKTETLRTLDGLVDVYLPDIKYFDGHRAQLYSAAPGYFPTAVAALREMLRQVGRCEYDTDGMMTRGVIVRHLVLPGGRQDSIALLQALYKEFGSQAFPLSLMSQYTPEFATDCPFPELHRRVTSFEYDAVCKEAQRLGFDGYVQERESASSVFTPDFFEKTF